MAQFLNQWLTVVCSFLEMDVDGETAKPSSMSKKRKSTKITKRRHRKASNAISFPRYDRNARKEKAPRKGK
jgi:hypothetical protein